MPRSLKREASNASLPEQSPRKKTIKSSLSRVNLRASKSIFGLRQKPVSESLPSTDNVVQSRKRSFLGSIRSRAGSALQSKRTKHRHDDVQVTETSARKASGSAHSRLLPHWDLSFFSRSQPIRIPAGRVEDTLTTASGSPPLQPESHLQLRLQNELDLGSSLAFDNSSFPQSVASPAHISFRPPRASYEYSASTSPEIPHSGSTPSVGLWQPRVRNRGSEQSSSSCTTSTSPATTEVEDLLVTKFEGLWEKNYRSCAESQCLRSLDELICQPNFAVNHLPANENQGREVSKQDAKSKLHETPRIENVAASPKPEDSADNAPKSLRTRTNSHVRFASGNKGSSCPSQTDADMSPTLPAMSINNPRARHFAPSATRPPTPGVDCVELENTVIGYDADTYKELQIHLSSQSPSDEVRIAPAPSQQELPGESAARKSLDRITDPRRSQRGSTGSDSIETEFTDMKDGGVKSVKSIVMEGLRGPMSGLGSARGRFSGKNSSIRVAGKVE